LFNLITRQDRIFFGNFFSVKKKKEAKYFSDSFQLCDLFVYLRKASMMTRSDDLLWNILLEFRKQYRQNPTGLDVVSAVISGESFQVFCNQIPEISLQQSGVAVCLKRPDQFTPDISIFMVDDDLNVKVLQAGKLSDMEIEFVICFLPFCIMPNRASRLGRAVSVIHLAQSIDGRMATVSHNSKWISNSENLIYVHRMRALSDSILIGSHTLHFDKPALTVRYVTGPNPVKIVVGNSAVRFSSILKSNDRVIHFVTRPRPPRQNIETVCLQVTSGYIQPVSLLEEIYRMGMHSVYIEGGAFTASSFIREKAVDLMNIYIAPVILGSGISIEFPGIENVKDALSLQNGRIMAMGKGILFRGQIKQINK
jgi:diaminohydroxyphosphoribosylaminopyrimidine deaminase / 5-amino-6-(5-phosphoribosylamino)uracil reductase